MTHEQFVYWLSGFLTNVDVLDSKLVDQIREALKQVKLKTDSAVFFRGDE